MFSNAILWLLGTPAVFCCGYLLLLTLLSGKTRMPAAGARTLRFDVIVPAHDEEASIGRVVRSLHRSDWPRGAFRIVVVADNCTDETAALARVAGAEVLERHDVGLRGKGYALEHAFVASRVRGFADAVVVVDADSEVSANLLAACAARIENGAHAVQVHYGVLEPRASWRTRLLCIAMAAFHRLRSRGRERLGLSCGFRGNGWCVTHALLEQVPYRAFRSRKTSSTASTSASQDSEFTMPMRLRCEPKWLPTPRAPLPSVAVGARAMAAVADEQRRCSAPPCRAEPHLPRSRCRSARIAAVTHRAERRGVVGGGSGARSRAGGCGSVAFWLGSACAASLVPLRAAWVQLSGMGALGLVDLARAPFFWRGRCCCRCARAGRRPGCARQEARVSDRRRRLRSRMLGTAVTSRGAACQRQASWSACLIRHARRPAVWLFHTRVERGAVITLAAKLVPESTVGQPHHATSMGPHAATSSAASIAIKTACSRSAARSRSPHGLRASGLATSSIATPVL